LVIPAYDLHSFDSQQIEDNAITCWFMNLAISIPPGLGPKGAGRQSPHKASLSGIHVIHADPVIVPMNPRARDLVELLQLAAADLADLAIRDLDLSIIT